MLNMVLPDSSLNLTNTSVTFVILLRDSYWNIQVQIPFQENGKNIVKILENSKTYKNFMVLKNLHVSLRLGLEKYQ